MRDWEKYRFLNSRLLFVLTAVMCSLLLAFSLMPASGLGYASSLIRQAYADSIAQDDYEDDSYFDDDESSFCDEENLEDQDYDYDQITDGSSDLDLGDYSGDLQDNYNPESNESETGELDTLKLKENTDNSLSLKLGDNSSDASNSDETLADTADDIDEYFDDATYTMPTGNGTSQDPYLVSNSQQFENLRNILKTNPAAYVKLTNDVSNISSNKWEQFCTDADCAFCGTFDGDNHTITLNDGMNTTASNSGGGLFSYVGSNACIKNLTIEASLYCVSSHAGIFADTVKRGAKNVTFSNCSSSGELVCNGGFDDVDGAVYAGIAAFIDNDATVAFDNCTNTAKLSADNKHTRYGGGIAGYANDDHITMTNCSNSGEINAGAALSQEFKWGYLVFQIACSILLGQLAKKLDEYYKNLKAYNEVLKKCKEDLQKFSSDNGSISKDTLKRRLDDNAKKLAEFRQNKTSYDDIRAFFKAPDNQAKYSLLQNYYADIEAKVSSVQNALSATNGTIAKNVVLNSEVASLLGLDSSDTAFNSPFLAALYSQDDRFEITSLLSRLNNEHSLKIYYDSLIEKCGKSGVAEASGIMSYETFKNYVGNLKSSIGSSSSITADVLSKIDPKLYQFIWFSNHASNISQLTTDQSLKVLSSLYDTYNNLDEVFTELKDLNDANSINTYLGRYNVCDADSKIAAQAWVNKVKDAEKIADTATQKCLQKFGLDFHNISEKCIKNKIFASILLYENENGFTPIKFYAFSKNFPGCDNGIIYSAKQAASFRASWDQLKNYYSNGSMWGVADTNVISGIPFSGAISEITTSMLSESLSSAASSLATGEGGLGGVHYNSYGGGMIAYLDGDRNGNTLHINSCSNSSSITGGHAAGGLIGYSEDFDIDIVSSSNEGTIGCTDNCCNPASGGLLGSCKDVREGQYININKSFNSGMVLSREEAGGLIGHLYDEDLSVNITDCGSCSGVAAPSECGGFIGWEDSIREINISNCYSYCVFDTATLNTHYINFSLFIIPGLQDVYCPSTGNGCTPGAFFGEIDDKERVRFSNCYYLNGCNAVGPDSNTSAPYAEELHEVGDDDYRMGVVTYNLNKGDVSCDAPFGQVIDDLTLGNQAVMAVPCAGVYAPVYKDTHSSNTVYTNYNPRTIELHQIEFFTNHASIDSGNSVVNIKDGNSYTFKVEVDNAFELDYVTWRNSKGETEQLKGELELDSDGNVTDDYQFTIENVSDNLIVNVETKAFTLSQPTGYGNSDSPYLISNISQLAWFIQQVNNGMGYEYCAKLTADIDVSSYKLTPMLSQTIGYKGVFDGDGHSITGIASDSSNYAFFNYVDGGTIKNLTLSGVFNIAAFSVWGHDAKFINCKAQGTVSGASSAVGGICSRVWGTDNIFESCVNECSVSNNAPDRFSCVGGICGLITDGTETDFDSNGRSAGATFTQCVNSGNICGTSSYDIHTAGIVGLMMPLNREDGGHDLLTGGSFVNINYCENAGNIYGDGDQTSCGGIMGCVDELDSSHGDAQINIMHTINTGNIGYDAYNSKKSVQDAAGILCWTYDPDVDVTIDGCVVDGKIWCPDTTVSAGSGCGGFIANAEEGDTIIIKNSYTTGYVTGSHKYKGYFIGGYGTPLVCQWYTLIPYIFNQLVKWIKDGATCPDFVIENCYYMQNGTPTQPICDQGDDDVGKFNKNVTRVTDYDLTSGSLAYKINPDKDNPIFGQNLDIDEIVETSTQTKFDDNGIAVLDEYGNMVTEETTTTTELTSQSSPCPMNIDNRKTAKVYEVKQGSNVFYSNYDYSNAKGDYTISVNAENGYIKGNTAVSDGSDAEFTFEPISNGYVLESVYVDNNMVDNPQDSIYTFKSVKENHSIYAVFTNEKEPELDNEINGLPTYKLTNAQEFTWFANRINEGCQYNAKLMNNIDLTNYPTCPQIKNFKNTFIGNKSSDDEENFTLYRNANESIFNNPSSASLSNFNVVINASNNVFNSAALCDEAQDVTIDNVNISGNMYDIYGHCAAYIGYAKGNTLIKNCKSSVNITTHDSGEANVAAYIGQTKQESSTTIENCSNTGLINSSAAKGSYAAAAIAFAESEHTKYSVTNFNNKGAITASGSAGSVFAEFDTKDTVINKSYDSVITNCTNNAKISAQNSGGFIGAITDVDPCRISIFNSQSSGDVYSKDKDEATGGNSASGGAIGYVNDGDVDVLIENCVVNCGSIKADGSYAGGFIGCLKSDDDFTKIVNSFVFCTDIWGDDAYGYMLGCNDDWNQEAENVYVYAPDSLNMRLTGDESDSEWNGNVKKLGYNEFSDGRLVITLNNNAEQDIFGQIIDLEGMAKDKCPVIGGNKVYEVNRLINNENMTVYSNYSSLDSQQYKVVSFANNTPDKGTAEPASNIFVKQGSSFEIEFTGYNGYTLDSVFINDVKVTDHEVYKNGKYTIEDVSDDILVSYSFGLGYLPEGSGTKEDPYKVTCASELMTIARCLNISKDEKDEYLISRKLDDNIVIHITKDIDMSGTKWEKVSHFSGVIYGTNSYGKPSELINLTEEYGSEVALFQNLDKANIYDIKFDIDFSTKEDCGGIAMTSNQSSFTNVTVKGKIKSNDDNNPVIGGFAANGIDGSTYNKCTSALNIYRTDNDEDTVIGGFLGRWMSGQTVGDTFIECVNDSSINSNTDADHILNGKSDSAGGFVGKTKSGINKDAYNTFKSCINTGHIIGDCAGGFIGNLDNGGYCNLKFDTCSNYGSVEGDDVGGFVGITSKFDNESHLYFDYCMNYGAITSCEASAGEDGNNAGGFVGTADCGSGSDGGGRWWFAKCGNVGTIKTFGRYSGNGGMIGESQYVNRIDMDYCYSAGNQVDDNGKCRKGRLCGQSDDKDLHFNHFYFIEGLGHVGGSKRYKGNMAAAFTASDFASGKVTYLLNKASNDTRYRQVLDDFSTYSNNQIYPDPTMDVSGDKHKVYMLNDGTYSNFDPNLKQDQTGTIALHTISVSSSGPGKATPSGSLHKYTGENLGITVKPDDGCLLSDVILTDSDGASKSVLDQLSADNTLYFKNINSSFSINVEFTREATPKAGDGLDNPYKITNYNELLWAAKQVNSGRTNINIDIENDIYAYSFNETLWEPIGSNTQYAYSGNFNGNGHIISGLTSYKGKQIAMFRYCNNANIHDLKLENVLFWTNGSDTSAAGLCYKAYGNTNISNISVDGKVNATLNQAGLINYISNSVTVDGCYINVTTSDMFQENANASGAINYADPTGGSITLKNITVASNCALNSNTEATGYKKGSNDVAAGVIANINGKGILNCDNCMSFATVRGMSAGGITSVISDSKLNVNFSNCTNIGKVWGNNCGGILGMEHGEKCVDKNIKLSNCNNLGFIGYIGGVIETAGGLVGSIDDSNARFEIANSSNYGSVWNTESSTTGIGVATSVGGFAFGLVLSIISMLSLGPIAIAFGIFQLVLSLFGLVQQLVSMRVATFQYAGGIIGEEDDCDSMKLTNIINVGSVQGESDSSGIGEIDDERDSKLDHVYSLKSACPKNKYDHDDIIFEDLQAFTSGKVGYELQENSKENAVDYSYGQRIDWFDKGPRESIPTYSNNSTHIYKLQNEQGDYYSNYAKDTSARHGLKLNYYNQDNSLVSENIEDRVDSSVSGDRVSKHEKLETINYQDNSEANQQYNAHSAETLVNSVSSKLLYSEMYEVIDLEMNTVKINPSKNDIAIVNVQVLDNNMNSIVLSDDEISYNSDGSVDIVLSERSDSDKTINVYCVNNSVHSDTINNETELMLPWNSTTQLPNQSLNYHCNNFYLTQDIVTDTSFNCMKGKVNICLNGHKVTSTNSGDCFVVNDETSDLRIVDCSINKTLFEYQTDDNMAITSIDKASDDLTSQVYDSGSSESSSDSKYKFEGTVCTDKQLIKGGVIYANGNSRLLNVVKGAVSLENITLVGSSLEKPVVSYSAIDNSASITNSSSTTDDNNSTSTDNATTIQNQENDQSSLLLETAMGNNVMKEIENGVYGEEAKAIATTYCKQAVSDTKSTASTIVESKLQFNAIVLNACGSCAIQHVNADAIIDGEINDQTLNNYKLAPLTICNDANFVNCKCADVYTDTSVNFSEGYAFNNVISVDGVNDVTLTKDFDSNISKEIDYRNVFKAYDPNKVIALGGNGANSNEIVLINKECVDDNNNIKSNFADVSINVSGDGKAFPNVVTNSLNEIIDTVKYASDSDIKLHLIHDQFNNVDKIEIKRNGITVDSYDSRYDKDTIVYDGKVSQEYISDYLSNLASDKVIASVKQNMKLPVQKGDKFEINISFKPQIESVLSGDYSAWTSNKSLPETPGNYILQNDVILGTGQDNSSDVWEVPEGIFTIDLNGHLIKQTANGKNAIHISSYKSVLTITDSTVVGKSESEIATSAYVQKQTYTHTFNNVSTDVEIYKATPASEWDAENQESSKPIAEVKGGTICGSNVEPQSYYAYETKAGAVVVDDGVFYMHAGNIVGNNAGALHLGSGEFNDTEINNNNQGVEGGAAVTVNTDGYAFVYQDAKIAYNSIIGDKDYQSTFFSAGVAVKGTFENYGNITQNIAYDYASSAVDVENSATFVNSGSVSENVSKENSYGAICNSGSFTNSGKVIDNFSDSVYCGISTGKSFNISGSSIISNNTYTNDDKTKNSDIVLTNSSVVVLDQDAQITSQTSVNMINTSNTVFTTNWSKLDKSYDEIFFSGDSDKTVCMDGNGELALTDKDDVVFVNFNIVGQGDVNMAGYQVKSGQYAKGTNLTIDVNSKETWSIDAVLVNDTNKQPQYSGEGAADDTAQSSKLKTSTYGFEDINEDINVYFYFVSDVDLALRGDSVAWGNSSSLPKESGSYALLTDILLTDQWVVPSGTTVIDLNGHNIIQSAANKSAVKMNKADSELIVADNSTQDIVNLLSVTEDNKIIPDENGSYALPGGYIGGCEFKDSNMAGAVVVESGKFTMKNGSIALNSSSNSAGAAGLSIFNKGDVANVSVTLEKDAQIMYNTASLNSVAACYVDNAEFNNSAIITNNFADSTSVAGINFEGQNSKLLLNDGSKIYNNYKNENNVVQSTESKLDVEFNTLSEQPIVISDILDNPYDTNLDAMYIKFNESVLKNSEDNSKVSNIVKGFEKLACDLSDIHDYFKSSDSNYTISFYNNNQLDYCKKEITSTYKFANNTGGNTNLSGDYVLTKNSGYTFSYNVQASVANGFRIKSVDVDGNSVDLTSNESIQMQIVNSDDTHLNGEWLASNTHNIITTFENINDDTFTIVNKDANASFEAWEDAYSMPTKSGNYRLSFSSMTTLLSTTWEIPENVSIVLDLNGIILSSSCDGCLVKLNKNSSLSILDNKQLTHKFSKTSYGRYLQAESKGEISLLGGLILGHFNSTSTCAFEVAKDAELLLSCVNVVGFEHSHLKNINVSDENYVNGIPGCGGAIYNEGKVTIDKDCSLCGNIADVGAAIYNVKGTVAINGKIYNNVAINRGAGIYNDGTLYLSQNSEIYDNNILDFNNKYAFVKVDDVLVNSSDPASKPQMITNEKFQELYKHKTYMSTTSGSWFEGVPFVKNAIKAFKSLTTFSEYFGLLPDFKLNFGVIGDDVTVN